MVTANFTEEGLKRLENDLGMEVVYDPWSAENRIIMSEDMAEKINELNGCTSLVIIFYSTTYRHYRLKDSQSYRCLHLQT